MMKYYFLIIIYFLTYTIGNSQDDIISNSSGIKFKKIQPGNYRMGIFNPTVSLVGFFSDLPEPVTNPLYLQASAEAKKYYQEGFEVSVKKEFYIGMYEISQKEWQHIMKKNPSHFNSQFMGYNTDHLPVENISMKDCVKFIKKLNQLDKGKYHYRLPSEIEWEYAARAGRKDDISWPDIWNSSITGVQYPAARGSKSANAWGLYDMLGNVWEWVTDTYNEKLFADPVSVKKNKYNVIKGSCFYGDVKNATYMTHAGAAGKRYDIGLRLVMEKIK